MFRPCRSRPLYKSLVTCLDPSPSSRGYHLFLRMLREEVHLSTFLVFLCLLALVSSLPRFLRLSHRGFPSSFPLDDDVSLSPLSFISLFLSLVPFLSLSVLRDRFVERNTNTGHFDVFPLLSASTGLFESSNDSISFNERFHRTGGV